LSYDALEERVSLYESDETNDGVTVGTKVVSAIKNAAAPTIILVDVPRL
jgi:hypothetical protein